jgi:hypothetical protein
MSNLQMTHLTRNKFADRKAFAEKILKVLEHSSPTVVSLSAPFGSGKTFLLSMMMELIDQKGEDKTIGYVMFNAWQYDMWSNPLAAFISVISPEGLGKAKWNIGDKAEKAFEIVKEITKKLTLNITSFGINAIMAAHGIPPVIDVGKAVSDTIKETEKPPKKEIGDEALMGIINNFKEALKKYKQALGIDEFYIFVDELDRCKPNFTVRLLEMIKHIFFLDEEKFSFVVAIDKNQLTETIRHTYGYGFDAEGYLRRFFNVGYKILPPRFLDDYINELIDRPKYSAVMQSIKRPIREIIAWFKPDFRTLDQILYTIDAAIAYEYELFDSLNRNKIQDEIEKITGADICFSYLFLIILKIMHRDKYDLLLNFPEKINGRSAAIETVNGFISNLLHKNAERAPKMLKDPMINVMLKALPSEHLSHDTMRNFFPKITAAHSYVCSYIIDSLEKLDID